MRSYILRTAFAITGGRRMMSLSPLSGVTVLDMSRILAGPFCSMLLGDLGAEVIKVEALDRGDDTRGWGPPFVEDSSCYFMSVNRNKKSICVNLQSERGCDIIRQLARKADVLIENFLPGKMKQFGLDYERLSSLNETLIYCSITGYGQTGPYSSRPGYDVIAASVGGLLSITGEQDGAPVKTGVALTDLTAGLYAHGAIMAALLQRHRDARGQYIECDLLSSQISCLVNVASNYLNAGLEPRRWGTAHESIVPYQVFETSDSHITIGAGNNKQFAELCARLEVAHLSQDARFASNALRVKNRRELIAIISDRLRCKSTKEWVVSLNGARFPYGAVNRISEVFNDPQVLHRGLVETIDGVRMVGPAVRFDRSHCAVRSGPPSLGQHTDDVLRRLISLSDEQIAQLRVEEVIG